MGQPLIIRRIDAALEKARFRQLTLRGIYLDEADYFALRRVATKSWRKHFGGTARAYPLTYRSILIIGGAALPVRPAKGSAVYAESGEAVKIPKRLSHRVRKLAA